VGIWTNGKNLLTHGASEKKSFEKMQIYKKNLKRLFLGKNGKAESWTRFDKES